MKPASDIANLSILGYDPKAYYTGRGPLEAANIGVELGENEVAFRCNLVTVNNDIMADYSAGHISDKEAEAIIECLNEKLGSESLKFYHGKSYRNLLVIKAKSAHDVDDLIKTSCTPPHDIASQNISKSLPKGSSAAVLNRLMEESRAVLEKHEINNADVQRHLRYRGCGDIRRRSRERHRQDSRP
jgi:2,3-bisphosphoglycerate-independent phosphoglycerate mutase